MSSGPNRRRFLAITAQTVAGVTLSGWNSAHAVAQDLSTRGALTLIDTHTHFYDPARPQGVPWPPRDEKRLSRTVLPKDYQTLPVLRPVTGTVSEEFRRRDAGGRFVELRQIGGGGGASVTELATEIADCLVPDANVDDPEESGLFDLLQYALSELANNVIQHAKAPGFAMAQYTARTDLIRLAISDHGIGVLASFRENGSAHWTPQLSDAAAIALALRSKVSSKSHLTTPWGDSVNAGVGLTLLRALSAATGGEFLLASGGAVVGFRTGSGELRTTPLQVGFRGTVCAMAFPRAKIKNFADLLHEAKESVGLLPSGGDFGKFFS